MEICLRRGGWEAPQTEQRVRGSRRDTHCVSSICSRGCNGTASHCKVCSANLIFQLQEPLQSHSEVYSGLEVSDFRQSGGKEIHRNDAQSNKVAGFSPIKSRPLLKLEIFIFLRKTKICFIVFLPEGEADFFPNRKHLVCNIIRNQHAGVESAVLSLTCRQLRSSPEPIPVSPVFPFIEAAPYWCQRLCSISS